MPQDSWNETSSYDDELEPISALVSDLSESDDISAHFYRGLAGRRRKAAVTLMVVWSSTMALHLFSWGSWLVAGLMTLLGVHALRLVLARPKLVPPALVEQDPEKLPFVSLMVAAKNEEAVIVPLVRALCNIDYPAERYELWVIDDHSTDRTPVLLQRLEQEYEQLRVFRRSADAGGGKSGALNQVFPLAKGEIFGVFDADAQVPRDLLRRVLPMFHHNRELGAVQVRKAIAQAEANPRVRNVWLQGQKAEMALDSYFQQQRLAVGGVGELRGNGQFVRREAIEHCGGWNEETITDDLDLTLRLHLAHWDIDFLMFPAVQEEGVTRAMGLWHQRNRWAEGGYQRYLDYWRLIVRNRMGLGKTVDLLVFFFIQYIMPTAAVPDLLMAIARNRMPMLAPVTSLSIVLSLLGTYVGLRRMQRGQLQSADHASRKMPSVWVTLFEALRGTVYMMHWLPVMASTTARISVRRKRLKWVKTIHHGTEPAWLDVSEQLD